MTKETEIKIDTIKLIIGKKEISLSVEDAKKLQAVLNELFKVKVEAVTKEVFIDRWRYPYTPRPYWDSPIIYLSDNSSAKIEPIGGVNTLTCDALKAYEALPDSLK